MLSEPPAVTAFIVLGSNIDPWVNMERACRRLAEELEVEALSGFWESEPFGAPGTPRFLNAAVRVSTSLSPAELKRLLRRLEADLGRRRGGDRNAPRTIDLDLVLYGDARIDEPAAGLRIPDPEIVERAYLALPLAEIGAKVRHPQSGEALDRIAARLAALPAAPRRVASPPPTPGGGRRNRPPAPREDGRERR